MSAVDDLRLAWHYDREGRAGRRDVLLTLAIASAGPAVRWAEPLRQRLIAARPDYLLAGFPDLQAALADPRVRARLERLRQVYPSTRVRWLLRRGAASRGPCTGRVPAPAYLLEDLLANLAPLRPRRRPRSRGASPVAAPPPAPSDPDPRLAIPPSADPLLAFYLTILMGIAVLLAIVRRDADPGARAA
jgi:hypothetical protein